VSKRTKELSRAMVVERLREQLARGPVLRAAARTDPVAATARRKLRAWQVDRLARTHADLLASPHFGRAAAFFISDLYTVEDPAHRDDQVEDAAPLVIATLPTAGLETVADAIELDAISETLDMAMVQVLGARLGPDAPPLDDAAYGDAYREVDQREQRERQIQLIEHLGHALERLVRKPFIGAALKLMHRPARMAGYGDLQDLLERGYAGIRGIDDLDTFLELVVTRETRMSEALFAGDNSWLSWNPPREGA